MKQNPTPTFAVANHGLAKGVPRYDAVVDQSTANDPIPRPFWPEPSWLTKTDFLLIQHIQETEVSIWKRYPGKMP